ncbi:hypothetical protein KRR26_14195 [Corallococcus sp. M34]|uniref:hypothetical protein n=1 Tax=Citreicoccus inhibens TaxID=2849499 RepID=UPI001C235454|nr:hypothetical protein [Citreicoccus inhibens]MBU8896765.1 hypothetical protein [Citreicoccus inhibens]
MVLDAIERLSLGEVCTLSMGESETSDQFMIISRCKPSGLFISIRAVGEVEEYDLVDSTQSADLIECVVGTRMQTLTRDALVDVKQAVLAAEYYFSTGGRLPSASWRRSDERLRRMADGEPVHRI